MPRAGFKGYDPNQNPTSANPAARAEAQKASAPAPKPSSSGGGSTSASAPMSVYQPPMSVAPPPKEGATYQTQAAPTPTATYQTQNMTPADANMTSMTGEAVVAPPPASTLPEQPYNALEGAAETLAKLQSNSLAERIFTALGLMPGTGLVTKAAGVAEGAASKVATDFLKIEKLIAGDDIMKSKVLSAAAGQIPSDAIRKQINNVLAREIAVNTVNAAKSNSILSKFVKVAKNPVTVLAAIGASLGTYPWASWSEKEGIEGLAYAEKEATDMGYLDLADQIHEVFVDATNPSIWNQIWAATPFANVLEANKKKYDAAVAMSQVTARKREEARKKEQEQQLQMSYADPTQQFGEYGTQRLNTEDLLRQRELSYQQEDEEYYRGLREQKSEAELKLMKDKRALTLAQRDEDRARELKEREEDSAYFASIKDQSLAKEIAAEDEKNKNWLATQISFQKSKNKLQRENALFLAKLDDQQRAKEAQERVQERTIAAAFWKAYSLDLQAAKEQQSFEYYLKHKAKSQLGFGLI